MNCPSHCCQQRFPLISVLQRRPQAIADITGSPECPHITGTVRFYQRRSGVIVYAVIRELPKAEENCCDRIFGFHIHEGDSCTGNMNDPFSHAMSHYDPEGCTHPYHAGDLPPLFGNHGFALSLFLTDRFTVNEIIGKTILIHDAPDDFRTQPSGDSGKKIACGVIGRVKNNGTY